MKKLLIICLLKATVFIATAQETFELKTYEENGKIGLIDEKGKKITAAKYDQFFRDNKYQFFPVFYEGLCAVFMNDKIGFIDKNGKEVIPFEYSFANGFTVEGLAAVEKNGKWGYINKKGKIIIPLIYNKAFNFENGKGLVVKTHDVYYIDVKGKSTSMISYTLISDYDSEYGEKLYIIRNIMQQFGFMRQNIILPNFYDKIFFNKGEYFLVKLGSKFGVIKNNAKEIVPPIYDQFSKSDAKYFYFWKNQKMGIIDLDGKIISPFIYGSIQPFKEGLSRVKLDLVFVPDKTKNEDERYGFIDEKGNEVIPRIYDYATDFINGTSKVQIGKEEFYIDKKGNRIK